jgi:outer membrane protein TolC
MKKTENCNAGKKKILRGAALLTAAAVAVTSLNGCAVHPQHIRTEAALMSAKADVDTLAKAPEAITGPIDLAEAIARAIKYNREQRIKVMEAALAERQIDIARFDMLPALTASAGYQESDELMASASGSLIDGRIVTANPPIYSISQDKYRHNESLAFTWNILDFGLSYVRANQQADRYLIAKERERKVVQNTIQDVQAAYWRAVSAERLLTRITPLMSRVRAALEDSRHIEQKRLQDPVEILDYQRELLDILRTLQVLQRELISADSELATLMGVRPGQSITLAGVNHDMSVPELKTSVERMEEIALVYRPELMEGRYQERIASKEVRAALLGMLPGISLNAGINYDSNDFLLNQHWNDFGAQVAWNMFNVFKGPAAMAAGHAQESLAREQMLALSMAVLSQVHLADIRYQESIKEYELSAEYLDVANRITDQTRASEKAARAGEMKLIHEELNLVVAELRRDMAYTEMQCSFGRLFASMGLDPLPAEVQDTSVAGLTKVVTERLSAWREGRLDVLVGSTTPANEAAPKSVPGESAHKDGKDGQ